MSYFLAQASPRAPRKEDEATEGRSPNRRSVEDAMMPPPRPAVLPPAQNFALTAGLIGAALAVAALLPNASAQIFAVTGARRALEGWRPNRHPAPSLPGRQYLLIYPLLPDGRHSQVACLF